MKESFEEYKKTLEKALVNSPFLYSGDVSKLDKTILYSEDMSNDLMSPDFIVRSFSEIYKETIKNFFSKEYNSVVSNLDAMSLSKTLNNIPARFMIAPISSYNAISTMWDTEKYHPFPDYFYPINKLSMNSLINKPIKLHYSPQIGYYNVPEELEGSYRFWAIDRPIQSLLWTIQNMEYQIDKSDDGWRHTMALPIYDCQYDVLHIKLRDIQKFRNKLIGEIID